MHSLGFTKRSLDPGLCILRRLLGTHERKTHSRSWRHTQLDLNYLSDEEKRPVRLDALTRLIAFLFHYFISFHFTGLYYFNRAILGILCYFIYCC